MRPIEEIAEKSLKINSKLFLVGMSMYDISDLHELYCVDKAT